MRFKLWILAAALASAALAAPLRAQDAKGPRISITSPSDGTVLVTVPRVDVSVEYSSRKNIGDDEHRITTVELRTGALVAASFDLEKKLDPGRHTWPAVDLSAAAAQANPVILVARAYLGPNRSKFVDSDPVRVTVQLDHTPPAIAITAPVDGSAFQMLRPALAALVSDQGGSGVDPASIVMALDGAPVARTLTVQSADSILASFTLGADLAQGSHTLMVDAKDLAGNAGPQAHSSFTIDTTAPQIVISTPLGGSFTRNPRQNLVATVTDAGGAGLALADISVRLDGQALVATLTVVSAGQIQVAFAPGSPLGEGAHTYLVEARDRASNAAAPASAAFVLDLTPPVLSAAAPANGTTAPSATPAISASWTDSPSGVNPSSAHILLDGSEVTAAASLSAAGFLFTPAAPLVAGPHTVAASVADRAGNIGTLTWTFQVADTTPPTLMLVPSEGQQLALSKPVLTAAYSDAGLGVDLPTFKASLDGTDLTSSFVVGASQATYAVTAALPDGPHVFRAEIKDKAGNLTQVSSLFKIVSAQAAIGSAGGSVQVTDANSPVAGAGLEVPPGALSLTLTFSIENVTAPPPFPPGYVSVGPVIDITPDVVFSIPATLTVPYSGAAVAAQHAFPQGVRLLKFDAAQGVWILMPLLSNDTALFRVSTQVSQIAGQMYGVAVPVADPTQTLVGVSGDAAVADGTSFTTITITPRGPDGSLLGPGLDVQVSVTGAASTPLVQDLGNGVYQVFIWSTQAGSASVTVTVNGVAMPNQAIVFTPMPARFAVEGLTSSLAAGASSPLRIKALKADGTVLSTFHGAVEVNVTGARDASGLLIFPESFVAVFGSGDSGVINLTNALTFAKAGTQQVSVQYLTQPTVVGSASLTVTAGPAALLTKVSGDLQSGATGTLLPQPAAVRVTDLYGNPVQGAQVQFHVQSGGARLTQ